MGEAQAPADAAFAARLKTDLQNRGIVAAAPDRERAVHQAIRYANAVLLVASPHTRSSRFVKEHLQIAKMYQRRVVFLWVAGDEVIQALPLVESKSALIDARPSRYETALDEITHSLDEEMLTPIQVLSLLEPEGEPCNPYKGLRPFTQKDAGDFFGRDALVHDLVEAVKEVTTETAGIPAARLLTIIGPSGSGKSSVAMAGLLPRLQQGVLPGSETWIYLEPIVPGKRPVEALLLTLAPKFPDRSLKTIRDDLEDDSARGLHLLAVQMMKQPGGRVVLLIDQFEELFTQTISEEERQCFIDLLMTALTEPRGPVIVLLTLRADFYDRPMKYHELSALLVAHQQHVPPMKIEDLRTIIEQPAALPDVRLTFEGSLVGDLLFEVQGEIGALPLLQFTLDQLFEQRSGHRLTLQAYHSIGGVRGALTKQAESVYAGLPSDEHRELARSLFLRLIDPGTSVQDTTRRRASLEELTLPDPHQTATLRAVADAFITARLLTTNTVAGTTTVEVSHEALIREWTRLTTWLSEAREDLHIQKQVSEDAAEWLRSGRPVDRLYRGTQLAQAQAWAERNRPSIDEVTFLEESIAARNRQEKAEYARQARELDLQRRATRRQRYVIGMMGVTSVVLLIAFIVTLVLQGQLQQALTSLQRSLPVQVTNLNDNGPGSLRQAIAEAHNGNAITFAKNLKGTLTLTSGELKLTRSVVINGPGASTLAISGGGKSRVFVVGPDAVVVISNLTIENGHASSPETDPLAGLDQDPTSGYGSGGGINNHGSLTLIKCAISHNTADDYGGGIFSEGILSLTNSTVSDNSGRGDSGGGGVGGGIYAVDKLFLTDSTISHNSADAGGGIRISAGAASTATITNSTISDNIARQEGGGISSNALLELSASTISGNTASRGGGFFDDGSIVLTNSTISGNTAKIDGGGGVHDGEWGGYLEVDYSTIYGNTVAQAGGGIELTNTSKGEATVETSIIADNRAPTGPDMLGPFTLFYANLIQNTSGAVITFFADGKDPAYFSSLITGKSPKLGPLQNNGGLTLTHALLPGSPAIDVIPPNDFYICGQNSNYPAAFPTDQRGIPRPQGKGCDLGAYEYVPMK